MGTVRFSTRHVGELFRSQCIRDGLLPCSDASRTSLNRRAAIGLPITAGVTSAPACILAPENTPSLGPFISHFFLRRAARAVQVNTDHRMPPSSASSGAHWRTLARQPFCYHRDGAYILGIQVAKQKGDKAAKWKRVYSTEWKPGGWATEAAALAARARFKHWVDYEMNAQQRTAQSEAAASRSPAVLGALRPPEPTRASSRNRSRIFTIDEPAISDLLAPTSEARRGTQVPTLWHSLCKRTPSQEEME